MKYFTNKNCPLIIHCDIKFVLEWRLRKHKRMHKQQNTINCHYFMIDQHLWTYMCHPSEGLVDYDDVTMILSIFA